MTRNNIYEILVKFYPLKKGRTRWLNLVRAILNIKNYNLYKKKSEGQFNLLLDPGDSNDLHYYFNWCGVSYKYLLQKFLNEGDTVVDVGVNIGFFSVIAANIVRDKGHVYSIEASPKMINRLELVTNESKSKNITICHNALWKDCSILTFNIATNSGWSSIIENPTFTIEDKYEVNAITLDQFCKEYEVNKINFLKLDIEGAEFDALLGSINTLNNKIIDLILLEVEPHRLKAFNHSGSEINKFLINLGYTAICTIINDKIYKITEKNKVPGEINSDYLYVRNELYNEKYNLLWK